MKILFSVSVLLCAAAKVLSFQSSYIRDCLDAHNAVRARHGVPALNWSVDIAVSAQKWANHLAAIDQLQHDSSTPFGENLFYMYGGDPEQACGRAVNNWYQEGKNYDFRSPHLDESTSHFSQLVWRGSKDVGIGTAQSKSGNFFLVARYSPRGNVDGKFDDNVLDVMGQPPTESSQETKDDKASDNIPAQGESSNLQSRKDQNLVYFKEINLDPSLADLDNTTAPNPTPLQQTGVESGTNEGPSLEGSRGPEENPPNSTPENNNSVRIHSFNGANSGTNEAPGVSQQALNEPETIPNNAEAGLTGPNEESSHKEDSDLNRKLSSSEPYSMDNEALPLYEGSDISAMNSGARHSGSEIKDTKARPTNAALNPTEMVTKLGIEENSKAEETSNYERQEEKDARVENFANLPMNDEQLPKSDKPPGLSYVAPLAAKIPKKPAEKVIKLPPAISLITPKRGKDFRVEIRFTKMVYTDEMRVPGSKDFEEAKRNITSAIINLFDDDDGFQEVQLISIRNGSVIATLGLLFKKDKPGNLNRLSLALISGKIGSYLVANKYESAVALPAGYLRPKRPIQKQSVGVCAQPCSKPNICYSTGCGVACCAFHPHEHKYHPPARLAPQELPSCPGTCDDSCFPDCDDDCCTDMMQDVAPAPATMTGAAPSMTCPGSCHFSCYPQCSPQCCATQYVPNPCHPSCPGYCAPSCDNACCAARKSIVNKTLHLHTTLTRASFLRLNSPLNTVSLSKQYSRYRSAQRAIARQMYLRKHLKLPFRRPKPVRLARPVRPRQRSYYMRRVRPESLGLEEYDRSIIHTAQAETSPKHDAQFLSV